MRLHLHPGDHFLTRLGRRVVLALAGLILHSACAGDSSVSIVVEADPPGARISPTMWGIFFEDINLGADGGLYAELIKNRAFEFPQAMMGWSEVAPAGGAGLLAIRDQDPFNPANPHYLRISSTTDGGFGVANEGFRGMGVRQGEKYLFSIQARVPEGKVKGLRLQLVAADGRTLGTSEVNGLTGRWKKHTATIEATATEPKARLQLILEGAGTVNLDMVSLFPQHTWKNRPGGLRADLVQMLADLKPGFMRFPGGCIVEGHYLTNRYQWKTTIGPIEERKLIINRWNDEFKHRPTPDYFQSFGLGFFEFFQLCEDIGAEPLPILNCGMACQFNSGELVPLDQLDPYIQDALDLIEFANGAPSTRWGARRAEAGHSAPFHLKFLGIGNEQWGPRYFERYSRFAKVLHERHPEIKLVSSAGPGPADDNFRFAWSKLRELDADIVDEHCYAAPGWFLDNTSRYDHYDRHGPKVFMGEYAAQSVGIAKPDNTNTLECALAEAAYMTGLERNADVVRMSSYAPLFGHVNGWQWTPNLIWCDNLRIYGTPSYYAQQLFSRNRGDGILPTHLSGGSRFYASAARDERAGEIILKVVNAGSAPVSAAITLSGVAKVSPKARLFELSGRPGDVNCLDTPNHVNPVPSNIAGVAADFIRTFKPYSLTVLRIEARGRSHSH